MSKHSNQPKLKKVGQHRPQHHRPVHHGVSVALIAIWVLAGVAVGALMLNLITGRLKTPKVTVSTQIQPISWQISNITSDDKGGGPFVPPAGYKFLVVEIDLTNSTQTVFDFAPVIQTFVQGSGGSIYQMAPAPIANPVVAGPVAPGAKLSGQLSYLVPADQTKFTYVFQEPNRGFDQHTEINLK